jgi:hypothetical protein
LRQLAQVFKLHPKQFLTHGRQHPGDGHIGQLVIWQVEREAHALNLPESPEKFQWRLAVPLFQGGKVDQLLLRAAAEIVGVEFPFQVLPSAN